MLKLMLGTALLLVGWSLVCYYVPMVSANMHRVSIFHPCGQGGGCQIVGDDPTIGIVVWAVGVVAIVADGAWRYRKQTR
jgi:hypothetical protein